MNLQQFCFEKFCINIIIWSATVPAAIAHKATHFKLQVTGTRTMAVRINCREARHCRNLVSHTRLHTQSHLHPHLRSHRHIVLLFTLRGLKAARCPSRRSRPGAGVWPAIRSAAEKPRGVRCSSVCRSWRCWNTLKVWFCKLLGIPYSKVSLRRHKVD